MLLLLCQELVQHRLGFTEIPHTQGRRGHKMRLDTHRRMRMMLLIFLTAGLLVVLVGCTGGKVNLN